MNFIDLAKERFSSRAYLPKPVEKEKIEYILEAARIAPTAVNYQPFVIYVIIDNEIREKINTVYHRDWMKKAPVLFVICGNHNISWKHPVTGKDHSDVDVSIVIDHMTLAATDIGLSTCWICNFDPEKCSDILNLPSYIEPVALLPLGYPEIKADTNRHITKRKPEKDLVKWI